MFTPSDMKTAEGMAAYCAEYDLGSGFSATQSAKHFSLLAESLDSDEIVYTVFIGLHNYESATKHEHNYAYAITSKRIICVQRKLIGADIKSISISKINDIRYKKGLLMGVITIDMRTEVVNVGLNKGSADNVHQVVRDSIEAAKKYQEAISKPTSQQIPQSSAPDVADQIKKFKDLLDMGAITQDEFDSKKKQLLAL